MRLQLTLVAAAVAVATTPVFAQQQKTQPQKSQIKKASAAPKGPKIRHQCKVGPYEKQTRLVMETVRDTPVYLAYWSSDGPYHCSFESWPGDGRAQWTNSTAGTVINLISGTMLIEKSKDRFLVHARDVDRMPYCGTLGQINGVLTVPVKRGTTCDWKETEAETEKQEAGRVDRPEESVPEAPSPTTDASQPSSLAAATAPSSPH